MEGGRLSRPKHCSKGAQPVLKTAYRSSRRDKHNCQRRDSNLDPLTPQSDVLTTRPLRPEIVFIEDACRVTVSSVLSAIYQRWRKSSWRKSDMIIVIDRRCADSAAYVLCAQALHNPSIRRPIAVMIIRDGFYDHLRQVIGVTRCQNAPTRVAY